MKKIICFTFGIIFLLLGIIGLALPIVPQIPFLVVSAAFFAIGSKKIKDKIQSTDFYNKNIKETVDNNRFLTYIFK